MGRAFGSHDPGFALVPMMPAATKQHVQAHGGESYGGKDMVRHHFKSYVVGSDWVLRTHRLYIGHLLCRQQDFLAGHNQFNERLDCHTGFFA
jgi:hypothetical protein